jgi:Mg/Co/Ni transporter MgtE
VLLDAIRLRKFISSDDNTPLSALMDGRYTALGAFDPQEEAVRGMKKTGYFALPVTDLAGVLL